MKTCSGLRIVVDEHPFVARHVLGCSFCCDVAPTLAQKRAADARRWIDLLMAADARKTVR